MDHSIATRGVVVQRRRGDENFFSAILRRLRDAWQRWQRLRDREAVRSSLAGLSDATLRDLGMTRAELGSVAEEMVRRARPERRHVSVSRRSPLP
jgi:uncharacterized protein YjiS (DUF1127 family)